MPQETSTQQSHSLNFVQGLYSDTSPFLIPDGSDGGAAALMVLDNCNVTYKMGAILKRTGYELIGAALQTNKSITGLHNFRQTAATQKMLATCNNSGGTALQLFYSTGAGWTELTDAETAWTGYEDCKVEMEDFIGYCFMVGYDSTDGVFLPNATLTGTTFGTTNTTSMPTAKYIIRYRDRIYIGNCFNVSAQPYRVYYSSTPTAGAITWTTASDFFDVDYSEEITGFGTNWDRLVVFTEYSAYFWDFDSKKQEWDIGCSAHRTIKTHGPYMFWANMDNVWISTSGFPQAIGGRVIDFVRGSDMRSAFAEIIDEEYHLHLGSVSVNGVSYSNCSIIYNIPTGTWRTHEYYHSITAMGTFYSSGEDYLYMGSTIGTVYRVGKYTDATLLTADDTQPISSWWQTGAISYGAPSILKDIMKVVAYSDRAQGLTLKMRTVDRSVLSLSEFKPIMQLAEYINESSALTCQGNFIQFEGVEFGSLPYWSFFGFSTLYSADRIIKA